MKVGSKHRYEELQVMFDFRHVDILFHELLPFLQKSVCHTSFQQFSCLCFHIYKWKFVARFYMKSYRSSSTFVAVDLLFHELLPFLQNSVRHTSFPDFSWLCFDISGWKLVASFYMKSYRSSSTFVTVDLLFSWVIALSSKFCLSHLFPGLFLAMLSHIWMKIASKLLYEELQIKFDFHHGWPTFSWVANLTSVAEGWLLLDIGWFVLFLLGPVGDLYCFSNTHSMLVYIGMKEKYFLASRNECLGSFNVIALARHWGWMRGQKH